MNIFVVESPFQLLSAIEAKYYFKKELSLLIIKYAPEHLNKKNNDQLNTLRNYIEWDRVIEVKDCGSYLMANLKLLKTIKEIEPQKNTIKKIFIGEYRSWYMRQYFNILNPEQCFIIDDGSNTIAMQKDFIPTGKYYEIKDFKTPLRKTINNLFVYLLFFKIPKARRDINLFTSFNLTPYSDSQTVIKHNFEYLKAKMSNKKILNNCVYFFGSIMTEDNFMEEYVEFNELKKIANYFMLNGISEIVYVVHRRESKEKIDKIKKELNFKIKYNKYPAELEFILMEEIPCYLASFYSTALYTVSSMIDFKEIIAFELSYEKINPVYRESTRQTYENYKKTMKVINLNDIN